MLGFFFRNMFTENVVKSQDIFTDVFQENVVKCLDIIRDML